MRSNPVIPQRTRPQRLARLALRCWHTAGRGGCHAFIIMSCMASRLVVIAPVSGSDRCVVWPWLVFLRNLQASAAFLIRFAHFSLACLFLSCCCWFHFALSCAILPLICASVPFPIWLNIKGDSLSSERLYKDLHAATKSEDQVESRLFLDVIVRQSSPILQLLTSKDKSLLVRWDTFFILNLCLHIVLHTGLFQSQPPCWTALTKLSKKGDGLCLRLPCKGDLASTRQARLHTKIPNPCGHSTGVGGLAPAACPCSGSLGWRGSQAPGPCTRSHG